MPYLVHSSDRTVSVEIIGRRPDLRVVIDGRTMSVIEHECAAGEFELSIDGEVCRGYRHVAGDHVHVRIAGRTFVIELPRDESGATSTDKGHDEVRADMPGVVVAVHCERGQNVKAGDKLVTLESMKLQVSLVAHRDGVVDEVHVAPDTSFERGAKLVSLAPESKP